MEKILNLLFRELKSILQTKEFAYHAIEDGRLKPIHKNNTTDIGLNNWKEFHKNNPVYIENDILLKELVNKKEPIAIDNLDKDNRRAEVFGAFGIKSIFLIPIIKNNSVVGFIDIPVLNEYYEFTNDKKQKCIKLVEECNEILIDKKLI